MRMLTFEGFLRAYLKRLSYSGSSGIFKLSKESMSENPRLREPLLLYVLLTAEKRQLDKLLANNLHLKQDFDEYFIDLPLFEIIESLHNTSFFPETYHKVYNSYLVRKNKVLNDNHTKQLMKAKILRIQKQKAVSNYRIYTRLCLNPGNFNDFMKNDRLEKLSLENTRKVLNFLDHYHDNENKAGSLF